MIDRYKHQPIVPIDWPPPVGQDFFGRLALLQTKDRHATPQTILQKQWCMLRGQVDKIPQVTKDKQINIQDVLKPCDSGQSLRVVVDGPPGIGKTTLCRKLLNMWAKGELTHGQYDLVLYCPLRNDKVAQAIELQDILKYTYDCNEVSSVNKWLSEIHGEGLLLIFDGWDELNTALRQSSLAARIIRREILAKCSVVVTSRSYASYSLLELPSVNRHVEVLGFSVKEIKEVVKGTLEKEPHLAEKLIQDLEVRGDVQSLCYIPLVCSIVILVYRQSDGQLPTTLTELYENFILQTVRRHVKIKRIDNIEPVQLYNLHHLPSVLDTTFKEICHFAYLSLKENNPKLTFSSFQLRHSLVQSEKEGYLGLMTTFIVGIEERYQFLHLSIQEFLAAWWIAKYEKSQKTEEMFAENFDNDHFRMCLMFVAGLTHLEHQSYQQYFNKEHDLQCKRRPLFASEKCFNSHFKRNATFLYSHLSPDFITDKLDILLLHLLYESQNTKLCQSLSQTMKNRSLCFDAVSLSSLFDVLCLSYFLKHSNTTWNSLDLGILLMNEPKLIQFLTNELKNNIQCKRLEIHIVCKSNYDYNYIDLRSLMRSFHCLQECHIGMGTFHDVKLHPSDFTLLLLVVIELQHLKVFYINANITVLCEEPYIKMDEKIVCQVEEHLSVNTILQDLTITIVCSFLLDPPQSLETDVANVVESILKGVTKNKSIKTFSFMFLSGHHNKLKSPFLNKIIGQLLKDNHTLQALQLFIKPEYVSDSLDNIVKVYSPLTALSMGEETEQLTILLLKHIEGLDLHCLVCKPHSIPPLFQSYPNLQRLKLSLDTADSVIELFNILQSNTTVKSLIVMLGDTDDGMGPSLQDMLTQNQTIQYLKIDYNDLRSTSSSTYLPFLTTGLSHNTNLQELDVPIPLSDTNWEQPLHFFNVISHKCKLTELAIYFIQDEVCDGIRNFINQLLCEQALTLIIKMLDSHGTITKLFLNLDVTVTVYQPCDRLSFLQPSLLEQIQTFCQAIYIHPSLQYIGISKSSILEDTLRSQEKILIDMHMKKLPLKSLPIIDWVTFGSKLT